MIEEAKHLREESDALYALLKDLPDADFNKPTQFKGWTINNVLEHLHIWNWAAHESHIDEANFLKYLEGVYAAETIRGFEKDWIGGLAGHELLKTWRGFYGDMTQTFHALDPKKRLKWAGPDMSARSSVSARLMETWAHGQEVYDHLGVVRKNTDRIKAIVVLGINTFGWTYAVRKQTPKGERPYVCLTSPSGAEWTFGEASAQDYIKGKAEDFCQTVTQVRNVGDTELEVVGDIATDWMSKAQCFAGHVSPPPALGSRFTAT